jgi:starch phosphorylase
LPKTTDSSGVSSEIHDLIIDVLRHRIGKDERAAKPHDWFQAAILALRDKIIDAWMDSTRRTYDTGGKRVYYLSLEFLIGRLMRDALSNMGLTREMEQALREHGLDLAQLEELEPDAALGNGGLGRLAACFMESLASLDIPAYGYGIRYLNGMFRQRIDEGWQVELPETWLSHGNPGNSTGARAAIWSALAARWPRPNRAASPGTRRSRSRPAPSIRRRAGAETRQHAAPVDGQCADPLQLDAFNAGDHAGALAAQVRANSLVRVLYPADSTPAGQELRLRQEYFFSSASIQDIVRRHVQYDGDVRTLPKRPRSS